MAAQTSMLHIRVDDDIKEQATAALTTMRSEEHTSELQSR